MAFCVHTHPQKRSLPAEARFVPAAEGAVSGGSNLSPPPPAPACLDAQARLRGLAVRGSRHSVAGPGRGAGGLRGEKMAAAAAAGTASGLPGPVAQGLKEALVDTLTGILSPVQEVRAAAEEQIKVLEVTEGE